PAVLGSRVYFFRSIQSRRDSLLLSRFTRLTATVMICAPDASRALAVSSLLAYLPVPTIRREVNSRPAITSLSLFAILSSTDKVHDLDLVTIGNSSGYVICFRQNFHVKFDRNSF